MRVWGEVGTEGLEGLKDPAVAERRRGGLTGLVEGGRGWEGECKMVGWSGGCRKWLTIAKLGAWRVMVRRVWLCGCVVVWLWWLWLETEEAQEMWIKKVKVGLYIPFSLPILGS